MIPKYIKRLAGQSGIYGLSSVVSRLLNYLLVPLHTSVLSKAEYGINTELYTYSTFLLIFLTYGMETGFFNFVRREDSKKVYSTTCWSLLLTSLGFGLVCSWLSGDVAGYLGEGFKSEYVIWFGWILASDAFLSVPFARLRYENKVWMFAGYKLLNVLLNVGLNVYFYVLKPRYSWLPFGSVEAQVDYIFLSNLVASVSLFVLMLPVFVRGLFAGFDVKLWGRMLKYSLPLLGAGLVGNINEAIDRVMFRYRVEGDYQSLLGEYGASLKLAVLMVLGIQMFKYAAEPFFFSRSGDKDSREQLAVVMEYFWAACLLVFLGVMAYLDLFKHFIAEPYWENGLKIVPIMLLANMFLGVYYNLSMWFKLSGQTWYAILLTGVGALISLVGNYILLPQYNYVGSAWMHLVSYLVMVVLTYILGQKYYRVPYRLGRLFLMFGIGMVCYLLIYYIKIDSSLINILKNTGILCIFAIVIYRILLHTKQIKGGE